ncbi:MAG: hypothetical protein KGL39_45545 [Patescibacteria group bacterium]|nr:hypothetical protein [Patescibacteria group bacterium]
MNDRLSKTLAAAIRHFEEHGYTDAANLAYWMQRIRAEIKPGKPASKMVQASLGAAYRKALKVAPKYHAGVSAFTIANVEPRLRTLLQARIMASADLITLNREQAVEVTMRRFAGWATSQPPGGGPVELREVKTHIGKRLQQSTYEERRMLIDQGHKLAAAVNQTIAEGGGAIAAIWHHVHESNYDARPEHVARDGKVYLMRDSWAHQKGLVKPGTYGYTDEITQPAYEPYCRCRYVYLYALSRLPDDMLTVKGRELLEQTKRGH